MARKLRLEFPGACYHVINRGNYRADIFQHDPTKAAFEACLFEACEKSRWLLHSFVLMRNHYHLALETPEGNLVAGMHWLQATFATRFNRWRDERGHLFQGRYKALLVEDGDPLGMVCHYIHLNPVRAAIHQAAQLPEYRYSSYWYLWHPERRPKFLTMNTALTAAGQLADSPEGRSRYADYLAWQALEGPTGKSAAYANMSHGWALGCTGFKQALLQDHALVARTRAWESVGAREMRGLQWSSSLDRILIVAGRNRAEFAPALKSAPWKLAIAAWMKSRTQASNGWLCLTLHLGTPAAFSRNLTSYRRLIQPTDKLWERLISSSET
jgi:putative transposase